MSYTHPHKNGWMELLCFWEDDNLLGCLVMPFCVILVIPLLPFFLLCKKKITVSSYGDLSVYPLEFEKMYGNKVDFQVFGKLKEVDYVICNHPENLPYEYRKLKTFTEEEFKKEMLAKGIKARKIVSTKGNADSPESPSPQNITSSKNIENKKEPLIQGEGCIWVVLLVIGLIIGAFCFIREKIHDWQYERDIAETNELRKTPRPIKKQKPVVYHYHTCSVCKKRVAEEGGFPNYATWCDRCEKWHCGDCAVNCKATDLLLRDYD